ncbi:MAG: hypothetical protein EAX81_06840 [Candidatus Thorarchaeota archaeon]|nr:hypothetical protein [Candidatus Thorarchaeota archaeon]
MHSGEIEQAHSNGKTGDARVEDFQEGYGETQLEERRITTTNVTHKNLGIYDKIITKAFCQANA